MSEFSDLPDKERLRLRYPYLKDKKIILFLGRIHWIKGLDILIKAYAQIVKERDDIHLLMVGNDEGRYTKEVKKWLKRLRINCVDYGLEDRGYVDKAKVTFTGMLIGTDKIAAYSGSDIFVLPSYSENFGMSAVEAMSCGLPVIISNKVAIYKEIERNKAGIIIDTNSKSLYRGIKLLLEDPELRKEIAMNGRRLAKDYYNIDKVADKMAEAYRQIAGFPE
jgi:glycosyltransferase involved in cell wall biosynthesis